MSNIGIIVYRGHNNTILYDKYVYDPFMSRQFCFSVMLVTSAGDPRVSYALLGERL